MGGDSEIWVSGWVIVEVGGGKDCEEWMGEGEGLGKVGWRIVGVCVGEMNWGSGAGWVKCEGRCWGCE